MKISQYAGGPFSNELESKNMSGNDEALEKNIFLESCLLFCVALIEVHYFCGYSFIVVPTFV